MPIDLSYYYKIKMKNEPCLILVLLESIGRIGNKMSFTEAIQIEYLPYWKTFPVNTTNKRLKFWQMPFESKQHLRNTIER